MPNLVQELGPGYFTEFFTGALFLHGNDLMQVDGAPSGTSVNVRPFTMEGIGNRMQIPADFFTGYKSFEYPILGYRRLGPNKIAYLYRRQTTQRGLRCNSLVANSSPASYTLRELGVLPNQTGAQAEIQKAIAAFKPEFDSIRDLPALLSGEKFGLVLSPNIIIEPATDAANDWYSVYYKESLIGKMNARGVITWTSPSYGSIIPELG